MQNDKTNLGFEFPGVAIKSKQSTAVFRAHGYGSFRYKFFQLDVPL